MERIGLLAGAGKLPVECAKAAKLLGYEVYAVALLPETDAELKECTADCRKDDTIMMMFVRELAKAGIQAFDQTALIRRLMPHRGVITKREPTAEERKDMEFGFRMAKEIGRLDVGQTAVVKNMAVMALEAIEGTDACIHRGGQLARGGAVVAKVAKPQQDDRFDVPTVGLATIQSMVDVGATALAIEADKTLLVEREEMLALAEANNITIAAI